MAEETVKSIEIDGVIHDVEDSTARLRVAQLQSNLNDWQEVTSDWEITYSSAGSPTIKEAWIRPITGEAKILVNFNGARVASNESLAIVVRYKGINAKFSDVRGTYNRIAISAISFTADTSSGKYPNLMYNAGVQVHTDSTPLDFYLRMRNAMSSQQTFQKAQIHVTL